MATDVSIRFRADARQSQQEIQRLRGTLTQLNKTLVENRNALLTATGEERKRIQAVQAANAVQKATLQQQIREAQARKQAIAELQRETRERERLAVQQERAAARAGAAQQAAVVELTAGARIVSQQLARLTGGFVQAAANMETFRQTINAVTRDAAETDRILQRLLDVSVDLVGINTGDLVQYAGRLMATGLSAEEAITAITGVTKRIAEQGRPAHETARALEQVAQSANSGRARMDDFRPLLRVLPTFWDDVSAALGETVKSTEDFNRVAEASGGHTQALVRVLAEMAQQSQGADLSTLNSQLDVLNDQSRVLQAELGEHLIPVIVATIKQVNVWIEELRNLDDETQRAIAWAAALATGITGVAVVVGTATVALGALSAAAKTLLGTGGIAGIGRVFGTAASGIQNIVSPANLATTALVTLVQTWRQIYSDFQRTPPFEDAVESIQDLNLAASQTARGLGVTNKMFSGVSAEARTEAENLISRLDELRGQIVRLSNASGDNSEALSETRSEYRQLSAELQTLLQNLPTENLTEPIESLEEQIVRAVDEVLRLRDAFGEVSRSGNIQEIQAAASDLTTALKRELDLQLQDTELTAAERLDLELTHAREVEGIHREAQKRITKINEENTKKQAEAVERQTDARIQSAERARAAEVEGYKRAAQSGQEYAEQLRQIGSVSQREAFVDLVNRLQEQGLSFDEARAEASRYLGVLAAVSRPIEDADIAYRNFSSTLVSESERSADAIANLLSGIQALGSYLGNRLPDVAGSLERSALNEQRYFQQNPIGRTIESDQQAAGEAGRRFVNVTLPRQQEREADRAAREAAQELREMASAIDSVIGELSTFENDIGSLTTKIGQFDIAGLASGNPLSIATLPFQLYDAFTFDQRQAEARLPELDRQNREAFERGEFGIPTDLLEFGRGQLARATSITEDPQLRALLGGLDPQIGKTTLDEVATIPDRIIETIQSYTDGVLGGLREELNQVQFNLDFAKQAGGDIQGALQDVIQANTALYQSQIDSYNLQRQATGRAVGNVEELNRILNDLNNDVRSQLSRIEGLTGGEIIAQGEARRQRARATAERTGTDRQFTEDIARAQYGTEAYDTEVAAAASTPAESIAPVIESVNEGIEIINAAILSIETRIEQSNDPEEIARLLSQVPDLIRQKYEMLRKALEARFGAGEITESVFNASLSELQSNEAREVERHSDNVLANTLRIIDEDAQLINASITALQTQIDASNDPAEIARLLDQVPALITEKYRLLRQALDEKYVAGEVSVDVYNASLKAINNSQASETERHSDAVLANTLSVIDDDVALIDASIESLQFSISQSDDPEAIAGFLGAIRILIADKYRRLRERLDELLAAEEISQTAFDAATLGLTTAENRALAGIDTQALAAITAEAQAQVAFINGSIENLRLSLELTDDPAEIQQILEAIKILTTARFTVLREELEALRETLKPEQYQQALKGLNLAETLALENLDTEKFDAISAEAQKQVTAINTDIENLRLSLQLTDNPEERQAILDAIRILTVARFTVLREELEDIKDSLDPEDYNRALTGINLGEQVALQNINTEKFDAISAEAQRQVSAINSSIENLRLAFELSDDSAERQQILNAIKVLTAARFDILIQELKDIQANLSPEEFNQALQGLELGKQLALENIDTEKFSEISAAAQEQVNAINTDIENLRLSLQLTEDSTERQQILDAIRILTIARFSVLRDELEKIKESLDPEDYNRALTGINLGEQVALRNIDTEKFSEISAEAQKQVNFINGTIENLRLSLQLTDDPAQQQQILNAIKVLTAARFDILIQELKDIQDSLDPAEFNQALRGLELGKQLALQNLDTEKFNAISAEAQRQVSAINSTIENLRLSLQLTTDPTETQQILDAIKILTAARFDILIQELHDIRDSMDTDDFNRALAGLELGKQVALDNIDTEKFSAISAAAKKQVDFIAGAIDNLELALQLTDDPAEMQRIVASIRILTAKRFDRLIQELKDLRDSFDSDAEFNQALEGLELGKAVALKGIDDRAIGVTLTQIGQQIGGVDFDLTQLFEELENETTVAGVRDVIARLRTAIINKHALIRQKISESADTEEEKARQIRAVDFQEGQALEQLGQRGLGQLDSLVDTAQFLLDNASEAEFGTRRQNLIDAIDNFYDARIAFINGLDLSDTDRANMLEVVRIQRKIALDAIPQMHESVTERLEMEKELQDNIKDLRDQETENEQNRLEAIADLNERHKDRLLDIEQDYQDNLKKIREEEREAGEDILTDQAHSLEDLRNKVARDLFSDAVNFDDLTEEQKQQVRESTAFRRGEDDINRRSRRAAYDFRQEFGVYRPGSQFGDTGIAQVLELLESGEITREQAIPFIGSRRVESFEEQQRATQEAETRRTEREADINAQAEVTATAIQTALEPLISQNATTAETEATTAATNATTAMTAATTATTEATTADTNATTAISQVSIAELERTNAETFKTGLTALSQAIPKLQDFADFPNTFRELLSRELIEVRIQRMAIHSPREVKFDYLEIQAGVVNVRGGVVNFPHTRSARNVNRSEALSPTEIVVQIDKKEVGRAVSEEITRTEQRGDNI